MNETKPRRKLHPAAILALIAAAVVLGYIALLLVGGQALRDAPFANSILRVRAGLVNLSRAEPPRSLSELPPLSGPELSPVAQPSPIVARVSPSPSPSLSPRVVAPPPDAPSVVTFNIEFENTTGVRLTGVQISDRLPPGTSFRSASAGGAFDGETVVWNIGTLDPGESGRVSLQVSTRNKGRITNRAVITSNEAPPSSIESSATVS